MINLVILLELEEYLNPPRFMKLIITESRIEQIIHKSLSIVFNGFEDIRWSCGVFNCGWGVCCDIYAV
jgi:hypothetical protein